MTSLPKFPRHKSASYRFIAGVVKPILFLLGNKRWRGLENLDRPEGFIVAANHIGNLDPVTTAHCLYNNGVPPRIMAKAELFKVPVLGSLLRRTHMIPVYRGARNAADALVTADAVLEAGEVVMIFPEGTHTKDPGEWPMTARTGVARMALTTGAPVIPVAQWGANLVLPPHKPWFRPFPRRTFEVLVGPPVDLSDFAGRTDSAALTEATSRIMAAITGLLAEIRGETPPAEVFDSRKAR